MRAVVQRVSQARVTVDGELVGQISAGLMVLIGVGTNDTSADARQLAEKIVGLRIFADDEGKMNRSLVDMGGQLLAVSQFTLWGDCRQGRRPSFIAAARPEQAEILYEEFLTQARTLGVHVETGRFQTHMEVSLTNDGPVTLLVDTRKEF